MKCESFNCYYQLFWCEGIYFRPFSICMLRNLMTCSSSNQMRFLSTFDILFLWFSGLYSYFYSRYLLNIPKNLSRWYKARPIFPSEKSESSPFCPEFFLLAWLELRWWSPLWELGHNLGKVLLEPSRELSWNNFIHGGLLGDLLFLSFYI